MTVQKIWVYGVHVKGVKNKCRKVDLHIISDLDSSMELDEKIARSRAENWIKRNMKSVISAQATATYWQVNDGMKQWQPFNKEHNIRWTIQLNPHH